VPVVTDGMQFRDEGDHNEAFSPRMRIHVLGERRLTFHVVQQGVREAFQLVPKRRRNLKVCELRSDGASLWSWKQEQDDVNASHKPCVCVTLTNTVNMCKCQKMDIKEILETTHSFWLLNDRVFSEFSSASKKSTDSRLYKHLNIITLHVI